MAGLAHSVCPVCLFLTVLYCRSLRVVLFGFQVLSAGVAFVIGSTQLVSALANAPRHLPLQEVAQVSRGAHAMAIHIFLANQS